MILTPPQAWTVCEIAEDARRSFPEAGRPAGDAYAFAVAAAPWADEGARVAVSCLVRVSVSDDDDGRVFREFVVTPDGAARRSSEAQAA